MDEPAPDEGLRAARVEARNVVLIAVAVRAVECGWPSSFDDMPAIIGRLRIRYRDAQPPGHPMTVAFLDELSAWQDWFSLSDGEGRPTSPPPALPSRD